MRLISFSDANGDALTYSATGLPTGLSINATTGLISGAATAVAGNYTVNVTVKDPSGLTVSRAFNLTLTNTAPTQDSWYSYDKLN